MNSLALELTGPLSQDSISGTSAAGQASQQTADSKSSRGTNRPAAGAQSVAALELRELVRLCLAENQLAALELVKRYQGQVFGLCFSMLGHRQDAEDATQDTMIRVLKNLHRWDSDRDFEPWLLTIAGNRCRTRLAKRMKRPNLKSLDQIVVDQPSVMPANEHIAEEVDLALTDLREEYRQAFLLFHHNQCSYEEISHKLNIPLGTVKTWVYRARQQIIRKLEQRGVVCGRQNELQRA